MMRAAVIFTIALAISIGGTSPEAAARQQDDTAAGALAQADRAFAYDDYDTAEARYREALATNPGSTHALSRLALLLTWKEEYAEAIALYRRALALEPGNMELKRALGTAYTWSEDYPRAIALHEEMLAERPTDEGISLGLAQAQAWSGAFADAARTLEAMIGRNPRHLEARVLLGQVHLWRGELKPAEAIFRSVLSERPGDADALAGLGQVEAARGRLDEALTAYDRALAADPGNRVALQGRAEALHWQGRTAEAVATARLALELYPDARDARRIGRDIGGPLRPSLQLFGTTVQDTEDNDLATWGAVYTHHLGPRGYIGAGFTHAQTDAKTGDPTDGSETPVARYDTLRLMAGHHFSRYLSLYGEVGPERTESPIGIVGGVPSDRGSAENTAGSLTLEINGKNWFTAVASVSQERVVGTSQAFMNDVGMRAAMVTTIFRPHSSLQLRLSGQKATFTDGSGRDTNALFQTVPDTSDDNNRDLVTAVARWRVPLSRPRIFLNYGFRWMSYQRDLDLGYFDPDHFVSNTAGFDLSDTIGPHFYWGAGIDVGYQRVNDANEDDVLSYRVLAGFNIGQSASIETYYARSDLAAQSASGFRYTDAGIRLKFRFGQVLGPTAPDRGALRGKSGSGR